MTYIELGRLLYTLKTESIPAEEFSNLFSELNSQLGVENYMNMIECKLRSVLINNFEPSQY